MFCCTCGESLAEKAVICTKCGCPTAKFHSSPAAATDGTQGQIAASYVAGALIPLLGWIMAIYWLVKGRVNHALGVGALSLAAFFFWLGVMAR